MKFSPILKTRLLVLGSVFVAASIGCSTSEETGASDRASRPEQEAFRSVAPPPVVVDTSVQQSARPNPNARSNRKAPRVKSSQDTVKAATVRRSRPVEKTTTLVKPPNAMYTVQVGAFSRAPNALGLQRLVKKRFSTLPVFNNFTAADKLYRVSVGKFESRREASAVRLRLIKSDSTSFGLCWVTYIKR